REAASGRPRALSGDEPPSRRASHAGRAPRVIFLGTEHGEGRRGTHHAVPTRPRDCRVVADWGRGPCLAAADRALSQSRAQMGRAGMSVESGDLWRVAAMTAMPKAKLAALLCEPSGSAAWVQAAAALDIPEALVRLGRMHLEGYGVAKDHRAAFGCFGRAARAGDIEAENMLGRCYENGWGVATDFARAALHYRRAAEDGHAWAQYNLGHLLLDGNGVAEDKAAAFGWYMRAAAQGHARAMNLVARCYEAGWGTARDAE